MLNFALSNKDIHELPSFPKLSNSIKGNIEYLSLDLQQKVLNEIPARHRPIFELAAEYARRDDEFDPGEHGRLGEQFRGTDKSKD